MLKSASYICHEAFCALEVKVSREYEKKNYIYKILKKDDTKTLH